ncbi:MAG: L-Ala-D/L-Glu epimerase [Candidatus Dichloromethanomonas elyunquensis]|nr:MAG: L-Ala-D/L-Glu epimerase [Candidatus Dichloromethanomonas elyunquensis]
MYASQSIIKKVTAIPVCMPLKAPYVLANVIQHAAEYVVVLVETSQGVVGVGECAPFPGETEETQYDIVPSINNYFAKAVVGFDIFDLESIHHALDIALPGHVFAKGGIDIAIYDAIGKTLGLPVYKVIGGAFRTKIPILGGMGVPEDGAAAAAAAEALAAQGFKTIKMKIGRGKEKDVETVSAVRSAVGKDIQIRVDANQAYTADQAIPILRALEKFELHLIEQPLPAWDWDGMARVAEALDTPIMVDEPISTPQDVLTAYEKKAGDIIKIKAMRCGGIYKARKVCAVAEACGLPVVLGSGHESSIGVAAEIHLAAATGCIPYAGEMNGNRRLKSDIVEYPVELTDGFATISNAPGLGIGEVYYERYMRE